MNLDHLDWPFYDDAHRALGRELSAWVAQQTVDEHDDVDRVCRAWVRALADAGHLRHCVPAAYGGVRVELDSRALCVAREALAYHASLADFAFAMQGLGSGPITLAGNDAVRRRWLPRVARGEAIAAFALSEPSAGSDALALSTKAVREGDGWRIDGCKTWISNGGIADFYCVFARTGATGAAAISAFVVPADTPGLVIAERIALLAPHPLARIEFDGCRVPADALLGDVGEGFKLAMRTLDIFRASVAAAANGFARRALDEAARHAKQRAMFASTLGEQPVAQAMIGDMAARNDASALLTARAAWKRDVQRTRTTREAAIAKLTATESAQQVIDAALQLHGAGGLRSGAVVEKLYREIRALRIYEGATEIQRLVIGRDVLKTVG
jgi:acyl-CoA dehydrogenase